MTVDYCLKSTAIFDGKSEAPFSGCVLISGNRIVDVVPIGEETAWVGEHTVYKDFGDKLIMPGLIDAHTHFFKGAITASDHVCTSIGDSKSEEECAQMIYQFAKAHPQEKRVRGSGWFITNWGDQPLPTKRSLDALLPDIPVYLQAADAHSYWLNSAALKECGVTTESKVESGYIGKFENGELDGMLVEFDACQYAERMFNSFSEEELEEIYEQFLEISAKNGITSMSEMLPDEYDRKTLEKYHLIKRMEQEEKMKVRLHVFPKMYDTPDFSTYLQWKKELDSDYFQISGVKGFIDGVAETYTGLLLEPYTDKPETCGINVPVKPQEDLNQAVKTANAAGIPVRIHCIADGSVRMALDALEASVKENGKNLHNTIEHIENIHPDDIGRFKELGVLPSMQPIHIILDADGKINRIGEERIKYEWPLQTLLQSYGELAIGTDYPVVDINPFDNIYAAVTRNFFDGSPASHNPEECLTMSQTLRAYTYDAADTYSRKEELGSLEKGKLADLIVIDQNLFTIPKEKIRESHVELTMLGGKIAYYKSSIE